MCGYLAQVLLGQAPIAFVAFDARGHLAGATRGGIALPGQRRHFGVAARTTGRMRARDPASRSEIERKRAEHQASQRGEDQQNSRRKILHARTRCNDGSGL
jgi:hypothetical protein